VHGHYTRAEIEAAHCYAEACGYGVLSIESPWIHREGVLAHQASATDLLFITLRKSEALFSPSTRYRDLALGPSLFHWESQSTTTASSPSGQRTSTTPPAAPGCSSTAARKPAAKCASNAKRTVGPAAPPNRSCVWGLPPTKAMRANGRWRGGVSVAAGAGDPGGVVTGDGVSGLRGAEQ